jgi:hypothetical protein
MGEVIYVDFGMRNPALEVRNAAMQRYAAALGSSGTDESLDEAQNLAAHIAAEDPTLRAWMDLHNPDPRFRFTELVSDEIADILEDYPREQLLEEIQHDYRLTDAGLLRAEQIARDDCIIRNQQFQTG